MKRAITSAAAVAILTVAMASTSHAWFFRTNVKVDTGPKAGRDLQQNSHNRTTTVVNRNDNRDYSDRSSRSNNQNWSDSRNMSTNVSDSRNLSDNRHTTVIDSRNLSDNRIDNRRFNSHDLGANSIMINDGYKPQVGHQNATVGAVSGTNNSINNSVMGYFGIGHQTTLPAPAK